MLRLRLSFNGEAASPCANLKRKILQHFTLETVACRRAKPALLLFRGKDLPRKPLQSSSFISFVNCSI
jgi:hypothetical protein